MPLTLCINWCSSTHNSEQTSMILLCHTTTT